MYKYKTPLYECFSNLISYIWLGKKSWKTNFIFIIIKKKVEMRDILKSIYKEEYTFISD